MEKTETKTTAKIRKDWNCEMAGRRLNLKKGDKVKLNDWEYNKLRDVGVV